MNKQKIYLISDLHLGHANIINYCNRPFADVEEMNETLINNWNDTVGKEDKVFFLGDFALGSKEDTIVFGQRLNGHKVFIYGNHDHQKPKVYYEAGFEHVSKWPIIIQGKYLLSHAPFKLQGGMEYQGMLFNIHGHIHNNVELGPTVSKQSACVCVERWDYKPVELSQIEKRIPYSGQRKEKYMSKDEFEMRVKKELYYNCGSSKLEIDAELAREKAWFWSYYENADGDYEHAVDLAVANFSLWC